MEDKIFQQSFMKINYLKLKKKKENLSYPPIVLWMNFMVSLGPNPINPIKMRSNFPLETNGYPLSGGKLI